MRLVTSVLLLIASTPALAEWALVAESAEAVFYIDPAIIHKSGNFRRVWELQDLKQRDALGAMSRRGMNEYDCKDGRRRLLEGSLHSKAMLEGKVLASYSYSSPDDWHYVAPGTIAESVLKFVCARETLSRESDS